MCFFSIPQINVFQGRSLQNIHTLIQGFFQRVGSYLKVRMLLQKTVHSIMHHLSSSKQWRMWCDFYPENFSPHSHTMLVSMVYIVGQRALRVCCLCFFKRFIGHLGGLVWVGQHATCTVHQISAKISQEGIKHIKAMQLKTNLYTVLVTVVSNPLS